MEMYKPDLKRAEEFWKTLQDMYLKLFGSSFITAAAINVRLECLFIKKNNFMLNLTHVVMF